MNFMILLDDEIQYVQELLINRKTILDKYFYCVTASAPVPPAHAGRNDARIGQYNGETTTN
jgi:hypothetical protein